MRGKRGEKMEREREKKRTRDEVERVVFFSFLFFVKRKHEREEPKKKEIFLLRADRERVLCCVCIGKKDKNDGLTVERGLRRRRETETERG